ncbi:2-succinylbenzoate--CoA ligase-like [Biomphalaria glabrata]|uniref:Medium-chain acyl-CoA ligase ACSF2, mitochondrial n=1 Tax=Biomphalaria glabrata TaxID=6526 RepID=A0A9U8EFT5_BIOGL|nr:2-succinylbenzoate--CoA ligase-like [Biomphalaria glabrata]XP_013085952.2 2-succinylbenzoate--CoA ligase-like [Biomphalaria glabrata]XP_055879340.1 2-succinylbenzoate--CoA ligase-like [Biomphalaria glabrata]
MTCEITVPGETVTEILKYWASTEDNNLPAFVSIYPSGEKNVLTRKEVYDCSKKFAHKLRNLGIGKGDIICNTLPNSLERVVCEFGITLSGATSMNGQVLRSDGEDFREALRISQSLAVIVDPDAYHSAHSLLVKEISLGSDNNFHSEELPCLKHFIVCSRNKVDKTKDFITLMKDPNLPSFVAEVSPSDLVTVMTTSGSTGYSKLVKFSHANICAFGCQVKAIEPLKPGDHFLNCSQLGWAGGYPQWYLSCGVTRYFLDMHNGPYQNLPEMLWRIIISEKIVYAFLTPLVVNSILSEKSLWENSSWKPKCLCLAGQPVKKGTLDIIGKLCDTVDINYGITECNLVSTHRIIDSSTYKEGCAGCPGYRVTVKIVDKDFQELDQGKTGQILVKSPSLCQGYLNNEVACQKAFLEDGWFCTDDAGSIGEDGKLYVEGRQSDCIMRGTSVLYPGWLEKKLKEFPSVEDVVVVGVPDDVLYNEICACILIKDLAGVFAGKGHLKPKAASNKNLDMTSTVCDNSLTPKLQNGSTQKQTCETVYGKSLCEKIVSLKGLEAFEEELRTFACKIFLSYPLVPKYYIFVDKFPLTLNGKICRKDLRELAANLLELNKT